MFFLDFLKWFFNSPTPIIATISAVIALFAYKHQRKLAKKSKSCEIAQKYSETIIPRNRYIKTVLKEINLWCYVNKFDTAHADFTSKELCLKLDGLGISIDEFKNNFKKIDGRILDKAYSNSGCNRYITECHQNLKEVFNTNKDEIDIAFYKFIIDMLNDIELFAILFRYDIAEEALVYQIMHQTFLKNMSVWYFFISEENQIDHDQYFVNFLWLYKEWNTHKIKDTQHLKKILSKSNRVKKL